MTIGIPLSSALLLSSCTSSGEANTPVTVTQTVEADSAPPADSTHPTRHLQKPLEETTTPDERDQQASRDPVFTAIETILADNPGGVIVSIKRWDEHRNSNLGYDIDIVVGSHVFKREVEFNSKDTRASNGENIAQTQNQSLIADGHGMAYHNIDLINASHVPSIEVHYDSREGSEVGIMDGREVIPRWQDEYGSSPMDNPHQVTPIPREESEGYKQHNPNAQLDENAATIITSMKASITASVAIEQALDQYPGTVLERAQLEREGRGANWVVQLNENDQKPLATVQIPAS